MNYGTTCGPNDKTIYPHKDTGLLSFFTAKIQCVDGVRVKTQCYTHDLTHEYKYSWGVDFSINVDQWPNSIYEWQRDRCVEPTDIILKTYVVIELKWTDVMSRSQNYSLLEQRFTCDPRHTYFYIDFKYQRAVPDQDFLENFINAMIPCHTQKPSPYEDSEPFKSLMSVIQDIDILSPSNGGLPMIYGLLFTNITGIKNFGWPTYEKRYVLRLQI
ncbi:unnamed protein product [Macrosiphum euphorbiae]|nr:unnamed protein product [Macrosiphum euphorbiae]